MFEPLAKLHLDTSICERYTPRVKSSNFGSKASFAKGSFKWIVLCLYLTSSLYATEFAPWFSPLWEFQGCPGYLGGHQHHVQSPKGSFRESGNNHTVHLCLQLTPWPYWNAEAELYFTRTHDIPFSYEAFLSTVRYQWLDDIRGDPFALVTGATFSFPGNRYLRSFRYSYHGEVNGEFHVTVGKEWTRGREWWMRLWTLGGWGIANKGNGWLHGIGTLEFQPRCFQWGVFTNALFGLGSNDIIPNVPFEGYGPIDHRTIDIGGFIRYPLSYFGTLSIVGWYNAYAHNFVEHNWQVGAILLIPFSL